MYRYATVAAVLALLATPAVAQVNWDPVNHGWGSGYYPSDMDLLWDGEDITITLTPLSDGFNLTYDATVRPTLPPTNTTIGWNLNGLSCFTVGPLPVRATLSINVNGKLVNGGGDADHPATSLGWSASLYYDLDGDHWLSMGDVRLDQFNLSSSAGVTGNGLVVIDDTKTMAASFILAPEYDYILYYSQGWNMTDLPASLPFTSTFECGGVTAFDGITLTLDATPVPEPATAAMLLLAVPALLRRRRKQAHAERSRDDQLD